MRRQATANHPIEPAPLRRRRMPMMAQCHSVTAMKMMAILPSCRRASLAALITLSVAFTQLFSVCTAFKLGIEKIHRWHDASVGRSVHSRRAFFWCSIALHPSLAHASGDAIRGSEIFNANCASCHAGGQNVIKEKRTLKKDALERFVGGYDEDTIQKFLRESSRHQNQAYFRAPGGKLSKLDFDDAASYVSQTAATDGW